MRHTCPYTVTVRAYVLGVLCERESTEFRQHAEGCPSCERGIAELTLAVRLLEKLQTETHTAGTPLSGAEPAAGGRDIARRAIRRVPERT